MNELITPEFIVRQNRLGKWINENAIIRLYGIMQYHGFLKKIDKTISGWKEVELMRRMRNAFTKTSLSYKPEDTNNIKLRDSVIAHFGLRGEEFSDGEIPTPINAVLNLSL